MCTVCHKDFALHTFWFFGSSVSECIPDQPRLFVWMVHLCFSSKGDSKTFAD